MPKNGRVGFERLRSRTRIRTAAARYYTKSVMPEAEHGRREVISQRDPLLTFSLRKEIRIEEGALHDPLTDGLYQLDDLRLAIANALKTGCRSDELASQMAGRAGRARVERELRQMMLLGLLDGTCSQSRKRLEEIRGGERTAARVLEDSRFGCQNSGACCRGYVFGSISEEEKSRIEALNPRKALPQLGDRPLFIEVGVSSGKRSYSLGTTGDACVFLEEGPRCGLHRAFGSSAKPTLCQL